MSTGLKEARTLLKQEGLRLVDLGYDGRTHIRLVIETPKGNHFRVSFSNSPSENRSYKNKRALLRRIVRRLDEPPHQPSQAST